jgi:lipopolysaccharide/colanic/teichoic acid biosynthesis glycosyltransferase
MTTLELPYQGASSTLQWIKRGTDILLALICLVVTAPLMLLLVALIQLDSPGPALYRQWRIGAGGRPFRILKLRSMVDGADENLAGYLQGNPARKTDWEQYQKLTDDPRLTRVGCFLRRWSLDELPQLMNVLSGEMSLVGPRPILPSQREIYGSRIKLYIQAKPGMTGLWQVSGRNRTSFAERVDWDARYVQNWSLRLDVLILLRTLGVILSGEGAF